ncbi:response regulator [Xanthomonas albilineans]|uniref:response regulator n=1 Tax=Xanthomonas albilineans TaxID=29447 RepID=UPI0027D9737D|nr:response regulator [Xanthomonas albilineans]
MVVLDLVMPGTVKWVQLVQTLLRADPDARVLVYTADESAFLDKAVIDAGAMGYVAKTSPTAELMQAIVAVCGGQRHLDGCIDLQSIQSHSSVSLTDAEKAVLLALCRGEKAQEIVSRTGRSYSTVTTHKYNGLKKLGLRDGSDLLPYL